MTVIPFVKMHGIGNDFVLIDNRFMRIHLSTEDITFMSNRHTGIGFDQLLLLSQTDEDGCDAAYQFFNPDGSEAEQCGNGQRCLSLYLHQQDPHTKSFNLSGLAGIIGSEILPNKQVRVRMGPMKSYQVKDVNKQKCYQLDFGNPHLVTCVDDVDACDLESMNKEYTSQYSKGINFEIVQIVSTQEIKIRVNERGTGETKACGSGACAAAFALMQTGDLVSKVKVVLPGGELMVEYNREEDTIYLTGPAQSVFTGEIII
jgi:diaminopimelate epimerase